MLQLSERAGASIGRMVLGLAIASSARGQSGVECSMTFRVLDVSGHASVSYGVEAFVDSRGTNYAKRFKGLNGRVPCQNGYRFILRPVGVESDAADLRGNIEYLRRPELWRTLIADPHVVIDGGKVGVAHSISPENYILRGRVVPSDESGLWLRIRSAVGAEVEEAAIDARGEFRIYGGLPAGPCILSVVDSDGKVRYLSVLNVLNRFPTEPIVLRMPTSLPVVTTIQ